MDLLIFDLDGTLIDSKKDLADSVNAARVWLGLVPLPDERVESYVGRGVNVLMRRSLGEQASDADVARATEYFLKHYGNHSLDRTRAYPGVVEALEQLAGAGVTMAVLTNKPTPISVQILQGLGLAKYFARIYGGNSFEQKKPDPAGVESLLSEFHVAPRRALMIGDSAVDVRTARNAGIPVWGVTYGFQPESLTEEPPDRAFQSIEEVARAVLSERNQSQ